MKVLALTVLLAPLLLPACSKPPAPAGPAAAAAKAQDPRKGAEYRRCFDRANYVDWEIGVCEREELSRQDEALNTAYRARMAGIEAPRERAALVASEKAWIAYRDAQCEYRGAEVEGGTLQPVIVASCLVDLTVERVRFLKSSLEDPV